MSSGTISIVAKQSYQAASCPKDIHMNSDHSMRQPNYNCDTSLHLNSRPLKVGESLIKSKHAEQNSEKCDGGSVAVSANSFTFSSRPKPYRELLAEFYVNRNYYRQVGHPPYKNSVRDLKRQVRVESLSESFKQLNCPILSTGQSRSLSMAQKTTTGMGKGKLSSGKELTAAKPSSLQELKKELDALREKENRCTNWLAPGIMVRIISRRLGKSNLLRLAEVIEVKQKHTALLEIFEHKDGGSLIYADQDHLQTVILSDPTFPRVMIVNGGYRGCTGVLIGQSFGIRGKPNRAAMNDIFPRGTFSVKIDRGVYNGRVVDGVKADDVATLLATGSR